jgi:hypothetical protein
MGQKQRFNPSLTMPIIDIIVAIVLVVATGYFWFQTKGEAKLEAALTDLAEARTANTAELHDARGNLAEAVQELADIRIERDAKAQYVIFLEEQVEIERQKLVDARQTEEDYTDDWLDLRGQTARARERRLAYNTDIFQTEERIAETTAVNADLVAQLNERGDERERLADWTRTALAEMEADPPSRFPEKGALASVLDISEPGEAVVFSLSGDVAAVGNVKLGVLGSLGLGDGADISIKEGGIYANLALVPRRASLDLEGGISQFQSRRDNTSDTGPFAGATFRLAPLRRERFFLLGGARYSHEDLGLRLGVGLGRR